MVNYFRALLILASATFYQNGVAEVLSPSTPNAGSILQEIQPAKSIIPSANQNALHIESSGDAGLPDSIPFKVLKLNIIGNENVDDETLHALIANQEGQELSLHQLGKLASLITGYYHNHDYPLAIAIIPAQTIEGGVVTIQVLEASYGDVLLKNESRINEFLLKNTMTLVKSGEKVTGNKLNQTLLLLNDIPGIVVDASIKKGVAPGTSDLIVNATDASHFKAYVSVANSGSASIGRSRGTANLDFFNQLGLGDVLSVNGLTSGDGMNYGRLSYELLLNGYGTRLGGSYSDLYYQLMGQQYKLLEVHGTSTNYSLWARHPLIRSLNYNLYTQVEYDHIALRDHIDGLSAPSRKDRSLDDATLTVSGDVRDRWLYGGGTYFNVSLTLGNLGFDDRVAKDMDLAGPKTQGAFSKINLTLTKTQQLTDNVTISGSLSGQWANDNLDSSQKMVVGGPSSVRAYDVSILSGDDAQLFTAEVRRTINSSLGVWQAIAFYDAAHVQMNNTPLDSSKNTATIQGLGVGVNWQNEAMWSAHMSYAMPIGSEPSLLNASTIGPRAWVEIRKDF